MPPIWNIPSIGNILGMIATSSDPTFQEFLAPALFLIGIPIGALIIVAIYRAILNGMHKIVYGFGSHDRYDNH